MNDLLGGAGGQRGRRQLDADDLEAGTNWGQGAGGNGYGGNYGRGGPGETAGFDGIQGGGASDEVEELNNAFLKEVSSIQEQLELIREVHKKLERTNQQAKLATQPNEISKFREKAQQDITEVSKLAKTAKLRLDGLVQMDQELQAKPNMGPGTPSARMRESLTAALRRKLAGIMQEFSQMRTRLHDEYQEVVERRVFTVTGQKPSAEEVEGLIETGKAETIFQEAILEQGRASVMNTVEEIKERHRAIQQLERSLMELHQVFLDMAVLVEAQGEMLNNIEVHIKKSQDHVAQANKELQGAKEQQRSMRKWMCIGIIIGLILLLVIVVPVASILSRHK